MGILFFAFLLTSSVSMAVEILPGSKITYDLSNSYETPRTYKIFVTDPSGKETTYSFPLAPASINNQESQFDDDLRAIKAAVDSREKVSLQTGSLSEVTASARVVQSKFSNSANLMIKDLESDLHINERSVKECVESRQELLNQRANTAQ